MLYNALMPVLQARIKSTSIAMHRQMPPNSRFGPPVFCCVLVLILLMHPLPLRGTMTSQGPEKPEKQVVVLYSNARDFPATEIAEQGLLEGLGDIQGVGVRFSSEYLELSRFRDRQQRDALADLLRQRYGGSQVAFVIGVDAPAAAFLMEYDTLFSSSPIVLCCIPEILRERIQNSSIRQRVFCVFEPAAVLHELIDSILRFKPATKQIYLVSGIYENDQVRADAVRQILAALADKVELVDLTGLSLGEILERCSLLPPDSVIFFSTLFVDARGRSFVPKLVLEALATSTQTPIFGPYDTYMGNGIVGGPLISLRLQGTEAGRIAVQLLQGQTPHNAFLLSTRTAVIQYDWRQLQRYAIDDDLLLPAGTVLFREHTTWDLYKYYIIGVFALLALQSTLIVGLVVNLRQRKRVQSALRCSQRELQTLAGRLISSQEEELSRLSREFHDDYAQRLAAVAIETGTLELQAARAEAPMQERITHIKEQLITLSGDIHALSRELHPAILKDLGLEQALRSLCLSVAHRESIPVDCHIDACRNGNIPPETALCVYRVIQEALRNIVKHARARNVDIHVRCLPDQVLASIEDDGTGFEPECARHTPGIGLASMRERVQYVQGEFTIQSAPGQGTVIRLSLPLPGDPHEKTTDRTGR